MDSIDRLLQTLPVTEDATTGPLATLRVLPLPTVQEDMGRKETGNRLKLLERWWHELFVPPFLGQSDVAQPLGGGGGQT